MKASDSGREDKARGTGRTIDETIELKGTNTEDDADGADAAVYNMLARPNQLFFVSLSLAFFPRLSYHHWICIKNAKFDR